MPDVCEQTYVKGPDRICAHYFCFYAEVRKKKNNNNNICGCMQNNFESIITNNLAHEMKKNNFLTFI